MFGKGNCLTVSKLQTSCFYYFKNYKLLNMITPPPPPEKWRIWLEPWLCTKIISSNA